MNKRKNTPEFRQDKVVHQICLQTKHNKLFHSRLANLLHPSKIHRHVAGYESRLTTFV